MILGEYVFRVLNGHNQVFIKYNCQKFHRILLFMLLNVKQNHHFEAMRFRR